MATGRLARQTGFGTFVAQCSLVPLLARTHGRAAALTGACVLLPMIAKRAAGNAPPREPSFAVYVRRIVFDNDNDNDGGDDR